VNHIVALSGGKDSTAMALRLAEIEPRDYAYVITPTGNEPPEMEAHWAKLEVLLGNPLTRLAVFEGDGLQALIRQEGMIPNFRARFCTRILKIEPMISFLESHCEGIYGNIAGVQTDHPLRRWGWGVEDVIGYLDDHGVTVPTRTDCELCFFQRIIDWKRLKRDRPAMFSKGIEIESERGATFRSPKRDTWPAGLAELAKEFDSGRPVRGESQCDKEDLCRVCTL
jgi:hypothetical protein